MKAAGGTGIALLAGAGGLFLRRTKMIALPTEPLLYFTPREYSIFHAVAEAVLDVRPGDPGIDEVGVAARADKLMASEPIDNRRDLKKLLGLFDNALAGFLLDGELAPFTQLDVPARRTVLARWQDSSLPVLRSGFIALKRLTMSTYWSAPATYPICHYPGPPEVDAADLPPTPPPPWKWS